VPVPAQAIHFKKPRRSIPSFSRLSLMNRDIVVSLLLADLGALIRLLPTRAMTQFENAIFPSRLFGNKSLAMES
jgi:hypothetical protein